VSYLILIKSDRTIGELVGTALPTLCTICQKHMGDAYPYRVGNDFEETIGTARHCHRCGVTIAFVDDFVFSEEIP
jgi:hypothetical protein